MSKTIPRATSVNNRAPTVFCTSEARHIKIFRHTRSFDGRVNITTFLEKFAKDFGNLSLKKEWLGRQFCISIISFIVRILHFLNKGEERFPKSEKEMIRRAFF